METPWKRRSTPSRAWLLVAAAAAAITAACVLFVDQPVARFVASHETSSIWEHGVVGLEWGLLLPVHKFALPIFLVAGMLATVLVKRWRDVAPAWMMIAGVHLISRLTTNWLKELTDRLRPHEWLAKGGEDGTFGIDGGVAFPSGHVVLVASVFVPLVMSVPREKSWLPLLVTLAIVAITFMSAARIAANAHWVSDATGGVTLVVAWSYLVGWAARPDR